MSYEARFTPTADDLVDGYRMHKRETTLVRTLFAVAGAALVVLCVVMGHFLHAPQLMLFGVIAGAMAGVSPFLTEWQIRRAMKKMRPDEVRYRFSEEGIELWNKFGQVKHTWELVTKVSFDERGILIYTSPVNYAFVPARAFISGYFPREELKTLLLAKLKMPDLMPSS